MIPPFIFSSPTARESEQTHPFEGRLTGTGELAFLLLSQLSAPWGSGFREVGAGVEATYHNL